ncbi:hypothetical protein FC678_17015 [Peribacillus simplex]|uniref:Uncharacterized protein n=1 Tax=Peribacillus simplex TaxID=1478 RepID=A0A9X8ZFT1_9BACI|nr:hypothetical protein [Peribacillus simplex]TKH09527.1 hypothetical protein FC678_17015 [Peribacillus simplex]
MDQFLEFEIPSYEQWRDLAEKSLKGASFEKRRKEQMIDWVHSMIEDQLKARFYGNPSMKKNMTKMEGLLFNGHTSPTLAVQQLFNIYDENG